MGIALFLLSLYIIIMGVIHLRKDWYEKYVRFTNEITGQKTHITDNTFLGSRFFGIMMIVGGLVLILFVLKIH